jgi:hypothetical protein
MRKALIGILMAATVATPLAAQDSNWRDRYERAGERNAARAERQEQNQDARPQRAERQQRVERQQVQQAPAQVQRQQVQQQSYVRTRSDGQRSWNGGSGGGWQRGDQSAERVEMQRRIEATREASRAGQQGLPANYREQAQRNQQRYEQQVRQDYRQGRSGGDWRRDGRNDRGGYTGDRYGRDGRNGSYGGDRYGSNRGWNRGWRNDDRYDWQRYRTSNRSLFHSGRYYAPYRNYNYNRLSIGLFLDQLFYSQNYWIGDPWQYRLPAAPYGTQWVRYYDDVVLVDVYSGEVVDVIYDFFW